MQDPNLENKKLKSCIITEVENKNDLGFDNS